MTTPRSTTPIDEVAEAWVDTSAALSPVMATYLGRSEYNAKLDDFSPAGIEARNAAARETRARLAGLEPVDAVDVVTKTDLLSSIDLSLEIDSVGWPYRDLNVIESPVQNVRQAFDLMPTATVDDWSVVAERLAIVGDALDGYIETLREGARNGHVPARRQVAEVLVQIQRYGADNGFFAELAGNAAPDEGQLPASLARDLADNANKARVGYDRLASFLSTELLPQAGEQDGVGRDIYQLMSRSFLGATIDLDETYEWGKEELARMVAEQESIANEILPGASVEEAVEFLDREGTYTLHGTQALQEWMQETSDRAVAELGRSHFDIPEEIRTLECMIAPTKEGGIYYTGPTDDFSRPGRMWWSVPEGVETFDTWRELTTVYHEGVPGHHLQIGQAVYNRAELNAYRRIAGTSGHAEGWALYAERLMEQLGYLSNPADRLGMLDGQRMRALRVVLDIGVHLGKPRLDGTGVWDYEYALDQMRAHVNMPDEFRKFEVHRYLGWPGQAPSYKVGQRIWEEVRDAVAAKQGADFSIKEFHRKALNMGGVGLDTLRSAMLAD